MRAISSNPSAGVKKRINVNLCCCQSTVAGSASGVGVAPGRLRSNTRPVPSNSTSITSPAGIRWARMAWLTATGKLSSKPARPKRAGNRFHNSANPMRCSAAANKFARMGKVESRVGSAISVPAVNAISLPVKNPPLASQPTIRVCFPARRNSSRAEMT